MLENIDVGTNLERFNREQFVIGGLIINPTLIHKVSSIITSKDFNYRPHCDIFDAILELRSALDLITLTGYLKEKEALDFCGGVDYLSVLCEYVFSGKVLSGTITDAAEIIRSLSVKRLIIHACNQGFVLAQERGTPPETIIEILKYQIKKIQNLIITEKVPVE